MHGHDQSFAIHWLRPSYMQVLHEELCQAYFPWLVWWTLQDIPRLWPRQCHTTYRTLRYWKRGKGEQMILQMHLSRKTHVCPNRGAAGCSFLLNWHFPLIPVGYKRMNWVAQAKLSGPRGMAQFAISPVARASVLQHKLDAPVVKEVHDTVCPKLKWSCGSFLFEVSRMWLSTCSFLPPAQGTGS